MKPFSDDETSPHHASPAPKPGILNIDPYVAGESEAYGIDRVVKVSANESPLGASPRAADAYRALAVCLHRHPDSGADNLRHALAEMHELATGNIVCGNGSGELIRLLTMAYSGKGDEVLYSQHGFLLYPICALAVGATPVTAAENGYTTSVDAMLAKVTERTRIVFLTNPNNPTGTYLSAEEVRRLRSRLPDHILLVIDGAYAEYVDREDFSPGFDLVEDGGNVVVTRSFSKIHGLAKLRVGWAYCPDAIAEVLSRLRTPYNVNAPAQAAAVAALHDVAHFEAARAHNDTWRPWLSDAFADLGLASIPSVGNFVTTAFPGGDAAPALAFFKRHGILARGVTGYRLPAHIRFTVGLADDNRRIVDVAKAYLES